MEESLTKNNSYLLRQYNIKGKKVIHLGDSYYSRGSSVASINSNSSNGTCSRMSSISVSLRSSISVDEDTSRGGCRDTRLSSAGSGRASTEEPLPLQYSVAILGACGVGKTTLKMKFMSSKHETEDCKDQDEDQSVAIMLEGEESKLLFTETDTENLADLDKEVACLVIVFSLTDKRSLENAKRILQEVTKSDVLRHSTPVILVGNKTDLVRARQITEEEAKSVALSLNCKYVEVSAALDHNVDTLLVGVVRQIRLRQPENLAKNISEYKDHLQSVDMAKP